MDAILGAVIDEGNLSWGISQWTLHQGSLQKALFMRTELNKQEGKSELWNTLFPDLDVKLEGGNYRILYKGKILSTIEELRSTFRGFTDLGVYEKETVEYWARIFANAGRNETIIQLQNELGRKQIAQVFGRRVSEL